MTDAAAPDWAQIRHRYEETQDAVASICRDAGITERELANVRKKWKWRRKNPRPFPPPRRLHEAAPAAPDAAPSRGESETPAAAADDHDAASDDRRALPAPAIAAHLLATPASRRRLLERLVAAISMKLEQLERRMSVDLAKQDDASATDHERETRAIGALIDNLDKLRELEAGLAETAGKSGPAATDLADEADRCRRELAGRLSRLVEAAAKEA